MMMLNELMGKLSPTAFQAAKNLLLLDRKVWIKLINGRFAATWKEGKASVRVYITPQDRDVLLKLGARE